MKKNEKHAAPLWCKFDVWFRGPSPSRCLFCSIGGRKCRKCKGCKENVQEKAFEAIDGVFRDLAEKAQRAAQHFSKVAAVLTIDVKEGQKNETKET